MASRKKKRNQMTQSTTAKNDRTSVLPGEIKLHILSFLPIKEIFCCSILSKSWNKATSIYPILKFPKPPEARDEKQRRKKMLKSVEQALRRRHRRKLPISKLVLHVPFTEPKLKILLDRWIGCYALNCNVQKLTLKTGSDFLSYEIYDLPHSVLTAKSITVLRLYNLKLKTPLPPLDDLCLRKLYLEKVYVDDETTIQNLLERSPDLEDLSLVWCRGLGNLKISRGHNYKLQNIKLFFDSLSSAMVEIESSHLQSFHYSGGDKQCLLSCVNLTKLQLIDAKVTDDWFHEFLSKFPLLEDLSLSVCSSLESIMISGYFLKHVSLSHCHKLIKVEMDTPNLLCFHYTSYDSWKLISFSSLHTLAQCQAYLDFRGGELRFLENFSNCKSVHFVNFSLRKDVITETKTLPYLLYNVKHLSVVDQGPMELVQLVDFLLSICPRPQTLCIELMDYNEELMDYNKRWLKLKYEKEVDIKEKSCLCKSFPVICWRHCLKEIKMERFEKDEEMKVKDYFLQNAEILEKIFVSHIVTCRVNHRFSVPCEFSSHFQLTSLGIF